MPKHVGEKKRDLKWSSWKHFRRHAAPSKAGFASSPEDGSPIQNDGLSAMPADPTSTVHRLASPPSATKARETEEEMSSRLWTMAWRNTRKKNQEAVESYQKYLREQMIGALGQTTQSLLSVVAPAFQSGEISDQMLISTMNKFTGDLLEKGETYKAVEDGLEVAVKVVTKLKDAVGAALAAHPAAGLAWGLLCAAMPYIHSAVMARRDMREGLEYVVGQINWYMTLVPLVLKKTFDKNAGFSHLQDTLQDHILKLYETLLLYQIQCAVAACQPKRSIVKAAVGISDWKASLASIKESEKTLRSERREVTGIEGVEHLRGMSAYNNEQRTSEQDRLIGLLRSTDYESMMKRNAVRVDKTWEWLPGHREFVEWISGPKDILVISADPGCGKSVMARYLVEDVLPRHKPTAVGYFFFKLDSGRQNTTAALCAILHNILQNNHSLLTPECEAAINEAGDKLQSDFSSLWKIFELVANREGSAGTIFCVFDALDECAPTALEYLILAVQGLFRRLGSTDKRFPRQKLRIICTTRGYPWILDSFGPDLSHKLNLGTDKDALVNIQRDIRLVVDQNLGSLAKEMEWDEPKLARLKKMLTATDRRQRSYLWVMLAFDVLRYHAISTSDELDQLLHNVPKTVADGYEALLNRVPDDDQDSVRTLLHLVVAAAEPLTLRELNIALSVRRRLGAKNEAHLRLPTDWDFAKWLTATCHFFLYADVDDRVYFSHLTAKEFLTSHDQCPSYHAINGSASDNRLAKSRWRHSITERSAHSTMAESCIAYLSIRHFSGTYFRSQVEVAFPTDIFRGKGYDEANTNSPVDSAGDPFQDLRSMAAFAADPEVNTYKNLEPNNPRYRLLQNYGFLRYVCSHWLNHFQKAQLIEGTTVTRDVDSMYIGPYLALFAGKDLSAQSWFRITLFFLRDWDYLFEVIDEEDITLSTTGHFAALSGHLRLLQRFLEPGTPGTKEENHHGGLDESLIHWASYGGSRKCVEYLLEQGHRSDFRLPSGKEPLVWAALNGHSDLIELLTDTAGIGRADINHKDKKGETVLISTLTLTKGYRYGIDHVGRKMVRLLVSCGADVTVQTQWRSSMLHILAQRNIEEEDEDAESALREATYQSLAPPERRKRNTQLPQISFNSVFLDAYDASLVKLFIDHGAKLEARNDDGDTPLHCAVRKPDNPPFKQSHRWPLVFLLHAGADPTSRNNNGQIPLHVALKDGNVIDAGILLLHGGADIKDGKENLPLHLLAERCKRGFYAEARELAEEIFEQCPYIDSRNGIGQTPLHIAVDHYGQNVDPGFISWLLDHHADVNAVDGNRETPVDLAVRTQSFETVRILVEGGAKVDLYEGGRRTSPLHAALQNRTKQDMFKTVAFLIKHGARVDGRDRSGCTPLHRLCKLRPRGKDEIGMDRDEQVEIAKTLLKAGASPMAEDDDGSTPLNIAEEHELVELVELLKG